MERITFLSFFLKTFPQIPLRPLFPVWIHPLHPMYMVAIHLLNLPEKVYNTVSLIDIY